MVTSDRFQVDLHGIVDLLAEHIYSSPRVFVRELLQNAVDAVTARRSVDPDAPASIAVETDGSTLVVRDSGIGLGPDEVSQVLATIGRSTKRDDVGLARQEFLGQFGVGLLSAFMVADRIEVLTRPVDGPTTLWTGHADGRFDVAEAPERDEVGTTVTLVARPEARRWFGLDVVTDLARTFAGHLPVPVSVGGQGVTTPPPWSGEQGPAARRAALVGYAQDQLGFTPFDIIDLDVPEVGLVGAALVVPYAVNPLETGANRVYLKRMLLSEHVDGLVPAWAYFVRCVVDTSGLRPVASREALMDDDGLELARDAVGSAVRSWLIRLGTTDPGRMARFVAIHQLGIKSLALHDDEMLDVVDRWVPFQTNRGSMTLAQFREEHGALAYVETVEQFRQLAPVAAAQGIALVNGGFTYDSEIIERTGARLDLEVRRFDVGDLAVSLDVLAPADEQSMRRVLTLAGEVLAEAGCDVVVRAFDPPTLPALLLVDRSAVLGAELRATRERVDGLWSEVLGVLEEPDDPAGPQLVLNHRAPLVRRLATLVDEEVLRRAVEGLYGQALLAGQHPVRPSDNALLNRSFTGLLERALGLEETT